jgi:hypothetical protein
MKKCPNRAPLSPYGLSIEQNYCYSDNGPLVKFTAEVLYRSVFYTFIAPVQAIYILESLETDIIHRKDMPPY